MSPLSDEKLAGLLETFKRRSKIYMDKAAEAKTDRDVTMYTAFSSTLEWVLREIKLTVAPRSEPDFIPDSVDREKVLANEAHEAENDAP